MLPIVYLEHLIWFFEYICNWIVVTTFRCFVTKKPNITFYFFTNLRFVFSKLMDVYTYLTTGTGFLIQPIHFIYCLTHKLSFFISSIPLIIIFSLLLSTLSTNNTYVKKTHSFFYVATCLDWIFADIN